ncbi:MAG: hypothetical protein U5L04_01055 [Trueperaceae bacterium]|nr:hypothetical protein [Trueperaceae bacterium]
MTIKPSHDPRVMARRTTQAKNQQRSRKARQRIFVVVALVLVLHVGAMITVEVYRASLSRYEIARLERDLAGLEQERTRLAEVIDHRDDAVFREQLARRQGFVYPDEQRLITLEPQTGTR